MRQARSLLYGTRRQLGEQLYYRISKARAALGQGDNDSAIELLIDSTEQLAKTGYFDILLTEIITPATEEPVSLRQEMNLPAAPLSIDRQQTREQEREWAIERLRYYRSYYLSGEAQPDQVISWLRRDLLSVNQAGPISWRLVTSSSLDQQLAIYYRFHNNHSPLTKLLGHHLQWRLLGEVEKSSRRLSETLNLTDDYHNQIGQDGAGRFHFQRGNESALCSSQSKLTPIRRGDWRDRADRRCSQCQAINPKQLAEGSDDPYHYTLLSPEDYQGALAKTKQTIELESDRIEREKSNLAPEQLIASAVGRTHDRVSRHRRQLAPVHQQTLATMFAERFNDENHPYRRQAMKRLLNPEEYHRMENSPLLTSSQVVVWLQDWLSQSHPITIEEACSNIDRGLRQWMTTNKK